MTPEQAWKVWDAIYGPAKALLTSVLRIGLTLFVIGLLVGILYLQLARSA